METIAAVKAHVDQLIHIACLLWELQSHGALWWSLTEHSMLSDLI